MNYVALDNALYNDVADISKRSNISINDIVKTGIELFISQFNAKAGTSAKENAAADKQTVLKDIMALAELESNWDGYGAVAVLPSSIAHAKAIVGSEAISVAKVDDVMPNPNGTITIVWSNVKDQVCLEVGAENMSYFADIKGEVHYSEVEKPSNENILKLANYVNQLN